MLLRFRVANFRSIRSEQELSLVAAPGRGEPKPRATETPPTVRVAAIYGANASGKSNVLGALEWAVRVVSESHARWKPGGGVLRFPFAFGGKADPTSVELDLLHDGCRYTYGFEVDDEVVRGEWLLSYPAGRPVRLFERTGPDEFHFGRALVGEKEQIRKLTRPNALYLSSAASNNHPLLGSLAQALGMPHIMFASAGDERARMYFTRHLLADEADRERITRLVRLADLGVDNIAVRRVTVADDEVARFRRILEAYDATFDDAARQELETVLEFRHRTKPSGGPPAWFRAEDESAGTRAWLALIGPLLAALRLGAVLVVDEIDSSLHPLLSSTMIRLFKDPKVNAEGAQLIFASHDTTLLGTMLKDDLLSRDEVWFTEKDSEGATSLFSLAEFRPRREENVERGYLQGRYGAVPYVSYEDIAQALQDIRETADTPR
jgi:uncharacterized protein